MASAESAVLAMYRGRNNYGMTLRIAVRATLTSHNFNPVDMAHVWFADREEFMALDLKPSADEGIKAFADQIWLAQ
jgi:hypothetical protein